MMLDARGGPETVFVHPMGLCESSEVGDGTRVWAFAHVMKGATVGRGCNICDHAYVEAGVRIGNNVTIKNGVLLFSGVTIEDDAFLGPGCTFTNDRNPRAFRKKAESEFASTVVRRGATVGANATIVAGFEVGAYAFVAAGAVVTRSVVPNELVAGNPARHIGWVCECGERLPPTLACGCGRAYRAVGDPVLLEPLP
jgi:UDP-2-acetamido-3-amino-2,3-dideoxy-glucuronate N-acetyltransferase